MAWLRIWTSQAFVVNLLSQLGYSPSLFLFLGNGDGDGDGDGEGDGDGIIASIGMTTTSGVCTTATSTNLIQCGITVQSIEKTAG